MGERERERLEHLGQNGYGIRFVHPLATHSPPILPLPFRLPTHLLVHVLFLLGRNTEQNEEHVPEQVGVQELQQVEVQ